ncbi:MmgE/PrpD family protein [Thermaerobacter sp. FW80]|uniref:MmgE/PrpD family protein n=1 Tax=Thermaerobacter sp. FW80 TaxID=2546351 RepID=UPI00107557EF|nr:MmgE/PrpD family protein [Thermaerobacter sp. FW80]QBS36686.1 MmgE/PrpD family protein [Thermaerobacter sp. FW80]
MTAAAKGGWQRVTQPLAEWCATASVDDLPDEVVATVKLVTLDGIGCALFGPTTPWGRIVADFVRTEASRPEVRLWGAGGFRTSAADAALVHGTYIHAFEMDDVHPVAVIHLASQVLPAAFAMVELRAAAARGDRSRPEVPPIPVDGHELLQALAVGMEVGSRIGMVTGARQLARGFHPSPNTGVFATAATAARLLRLDPQTTAHALGIAGSGGGALMAAQYGAMVKRVHAGFSARAGVVAALLAARGLTGTPNVLESPYGGFARALADVEDVSDVLADLGSRWMLLGVQIKAYPCCGSNHTSIDALRSILAERPDLRPEDVDHIEVRCTTATWHHVGWPYQPNGILAAQMNLAYTLAALLVDRALFVEQFAEDRLADPRILALVSRIRVVPDPNLDRLGREGRHTVELTLVTQDGRCYRRRVTHARGSRNNPLSYEEVMAKYERLAAPVVGREAALAVRDGVLACEEQADVAALIPYLAPKVP